MQFFSWIETTVVARSIGESLWLTASLSAVHLVGFTLIMSGALLANLRLMGIVFRERAISDIAGSASRVIIIGLATSSTTGLLLFSARAVGTIQSGPFQLKMALLLAAVIFHFSVQARMGTGRDVSLAWQRVTGAIGAGIWLALAVVACWFILFE